MLNVWGYVTAEMLVQVLKQCGDDLSRRTCYVKRRICKVSDSDVAAGRSVSTSPVTIIYQTIAVDEFDGKQWTRFGGVLSETAGK